MSLPFKNPFACVAYHGRRCDSAEHEERLRRTLSQPSWHSYTVAWSMVESELTPHCPIVLYAYGNMDDMHSSTPKARMLSGAFGVDVALFDLPSYGHTETDEFLLTDESGNSAMACVFDELVRLYPDREIFVWGRSLGTSFAAFVAAHKMVSGTILEAPIASMCAYALNSFPATHALLARHDDLPFDAFTTAKWARESATHGKPTLVLALEADDTLPMFHSDLIMAALWDNPDAERVVIKGKNHNNTLSEEDYKRAVPLEFFHPGGLHLVYTAETE